MLYGIYITYLNGYRERLGITQIVETRNAAKKTYCVWDDEAAAQRCADLLMSRNKGIKKVVVKPVKK